jgi:hypothetical protein
MSFNAAGTGGGYMGADGRLTVMFTNEDSGGIGAQ